MQRVKVRIRRYVRESSWRESRKHVSNTVSTRVHFFDERLPLFCLIPAKTSRGAWMKGE